MNTTTTTARRGLAALAAAALLAAPLTVATTGAHAAAAKKAKKATKLSMSVTSHVTFPAKVTITGKLATKSGKAVAGKSVTVKAKSNGSTTWFKVGRTTTTKSGKYTLVYTATASSSFKATFAGTRTFKASTSPVRSVVVHASVKVSAPTSMQVFESTTIAGSVAPARPGLGVSLQRLIDGTWETIATDRTNGSSRYSFPFFTYFEETTKLRVVTSASANLATGTSKVVSITVAGSGTVPPLPPTPGTNDCDVNPQFCSAPPLPPVGSPGTPGIPW